MLPLVPAPDAAPLPGPAWLFHVLLVFTFVLHLLFMNLALGGTVWAAVLELAGGGDARRALAGRLIAVNTFAISLAITTGVAPLLFLQVLYQQYFYPATIMLGWLWFGLVVALMVGYYAIYLYKFRGAPARGEGGAGWLVVAAAAFLLIAMLHVAVNLIHSQPELWPRLAASPLAILGDRAYWPRLLHFVLASLGFTAAVTAWWAVRQASRGNEVETNRAIAASAWRWLLWTTVAQVADGFVLLLALPPHVLRGLMTGGAATLAPLGLAILLAIGLLVMIARVREPAASAGTVTGVLATLTAAIAVMAIVRHQVRALYLEPVRSAYRLQAAPQWGNFVLFALLLVAGLAFLAYTLRRVLTERAEGAEAA